MIGKYGREITTKSNEKTVFTFIGHDRCPKLQITKKKKMDLTLKKPYSCTFIFLVKNPAA